MRWSWCLNCKNPYPVDDAAIENDKINPPEFTCKCERHEPKSQGVTIYVQPDLKPYKNIIDGQVIDGRRAHKEFLKRNGVVENPDPSPRLKERLYEAKHGVKHG